LKIPLPKGEDGAKRQVRGKKILEYYPSPGAHLSMVATLSLRERYLGTNYQFVPEEWYGGIA